jgi:lysozyme
MNISDNGLLLLENYEGKILHVYKDTAGKQTIGIGHLLTSQEKATGVIQIGDDTVKFANGITDAQAISLCRQDLRRFETLVSGAVTVPLTQNQFDAMVIFSFNIGDHGFLTSSALKTLNQGDYEGCTIAMKRWNKVTINGILTIDQGLVNRRQKEINLFNKGI